MVQPNVEASVQRSHYRKGKQLSLCCVNGSRHRSDYSTFGNGTSSRGENKSTSMEEGMPMFII